MARTTKGRVYTRGKSKNYYAEYTINGNTFRRLLRDKDGNPTTSVKVARTLLHDLLNPLKLKEKQDVVQQIAGSVQNLEERIEKAERELEPVLKISEAWDAYERSLKRKDCGERTLRGYEMYFAIFKRWVEDKYPDAVYMRDVTLEMATEYAASIIKAGKTANTFNKHIGFLKLIYRVLDDSIKAGKNPFIEIERRQQNTQSRRELTVQELLTILERATGDMYVLLLLGATTGMRLGDCCTLKWSEVDLIRHVIRRVPNKTARRKSSKQVVIGIPGQLYDALNQEPDKTGYVMPRIAELYMKNNARGNLTRKIREHFEACGIQCHKDGTGKIIKDGKKIDTGKRAVVEVGFHSLRHTYVSLHAERGTPAAIIQGNVGHGSPAMTAHYTHISDAAAVEVAQVLDFSDKRQEKVIEPERERLRQLTDELSADRIRDILDFIDRQSD